MDCYVSALLETVGATGIRASRPIISARCLDSARLMQAGRWCAPRFLPESAPGRDGWRSLRQRDEVIFFVASRRIKRVHSRKDLVKQCPQRLVMHRRAACIRLAVEASVH
jgi:hypothetical protein